MKWLVSRYIEWLLHYLLFQTSLYSGEGSIFAQHIKRQKKEEDPTEVVPISENTLVIKERKESATGSNTIMNKHFPTQSYILSGADSKQIHEENVNIIKSLSEKEIMEEREKLMSTMDPALIAFLKTRRSKEVLQNRNPTIKEQNEAAEDIQIEDIEPAKEILTEPKAENWLNFDVVETNKLAWMKNVDIPKIKATEKFEAR